MRRVMLAIVIVLIGGCAPYRASFHSDKWLEDKCAALPALTLEGNGIIVSAWTPDAREMCVETPPERWNKERACVTVGEFRKWLLDIRKAN